jgi:hypothetical protein
MSKPIINVADVELEPRPSAHAPSGPASERFAVRTGYIARSGDVIACPAGGRETAHQIINTGTDELRYLAVSTKAVHLHRARS